VHARYLQRCAELAARASDTGDAPVGALVVRGGSVIGEGVEAVRGRHDATAHAEIEALRAASRRLGSHDLSGSTLYTSVAPCVMCAFAIRLARIAVVVWASSSGDAGDAVSGRDVLTNPAILRARALPVVIGPGGEDESPRE
jgi:tRNA(adenine34) deaminase